jgi:quercetin dioxygenase-like cupin family protein
MRPLGQLGVRRLLVQLGAAASLGACGSAPGPATPQPATPQPATQSVPAQGAAAAQDPAAAQEERLAAIQKAMNELDSAAQQCWAVAATERFDIAGEIALRIDIAPAPGQPATAEVVHDTAHDARLSACLVELMAAYRWAPPLYGQAIQLPFRFRAPDGQNTIDRALVAWNGQGEGRRRVAVAVLMDETSTGSAAASLLELAIAAGGTTGLRRADRAELWYFLGAGKVAWPGGGHAVGAGDMLYVPAGGAREVAAAGADLHAAIAVVPGGREGAARSGALPTPEITDGAAGKLPLPLLLPGSGARTRGGEAIYADAARIPDRTLAASVLTVPAGTRVVEHAHAEAELLYLLAGGGTLTVAGVDLPVGPTSVVQIPRNTRHAFVATGDVRAVQIYTPAGSEPRPEAQP